MSAAHGLVEATSAIRGLVRGRQLTADEGWEALDWLGALDLILDSTAPRLSRIWALRDRMSAYDAAHAAAAEAVEAPLFTVDAALLTACRDAAIAATHLDDLDA